MARIVKDFDKKADRLFRAFDCLLGTLEGPGHWPLAWRRAFLLTLPVSFPLWALFCVAMLALMMALAFVATGVVKAHELWTGERRV